MKIKLNAQQHGILSEALRRFECFAVRRDKRQWNLNDLTLAWTGLGTPSSYKEAVRSGYMRSTRPETPRIIGWYTLTELGAKIVLAWHNAGYGCDPNEYHLAKTPPKVVEID